MLAVWLPCWERACYVVLHSCLQHVNDSLYCNSFRPGVSVRDFKFNCIISMLQGQSQKATSDWLGELFLLNNIYDK